LATSDDVDFVQLEAKEVGYFFPPLIEKSDGRDYDKRRIWLEAIDAGERERRLAASGHYRNYSAMILLFPGWKGFLLPPTKTQWPHGL